MEDLKGMKIRCTGTSAKVVSALGATPVAMPQNETYDALQKGVVDGLVSPMEALKGWKFAEVTKCTTENYGSSYSIAFFVAMNKKKWDSLPKDVQETIQKVNKEWIEKTGKTWEQHGQGSYWRLPFPKATKIIKLSTEEDDRWAKAVQS